MMEDTSEAVPLQWHHHANAVGGKGRYWITQLPTGHWEARQFTVADHKLLKVMECPSEAEAKAVCEVWDGVQHHDRPRRLHPHPRTT